MINIYLILLKSANNSSIMINLLDNIDILYKTISKEYKKEDICNNIKELDITILKSKIYNTLNVSNSSFDWIFCLNYLNSCDNLYKIVYKNITFYILHCGILSNIKKKNFFKNIYRIHLTSKVLNMNELYVYYIITYSGKRKLPKKNNIINANNINGGFTYKNINEIYIVRYEDYEKVIIHELLHHNKYIDNHMWNARDIDKLKEYFNISESTRLLPNEAVVEVFACLLNVIFKSLENKRNFKELLKIDQQHSLVLTRKLLKFQGEKKWQENSNSFCYIVLKTIFYVYINEFLKDFSRDNSFNVIINFLFNFYPKIKRKIIKYDYLIKNNSLKLTAF